MKSRWNLQILITIVFFLIMGTFSTGIADNKKVLVRAEKRIVQKANPPIAPIVKVKGLPDLSVSSIKIIPVNPKKSDTVIIVAVVKNSESIISPKSFLKIQIGGKIYPLVHVPGLVKNKNWYYRTKVNITRPGNYRVTAVINPDKKINETNYKNNTRIKNFRIKESASKSKHFAAPKSQPPTQGNPPPPLTPADELRPTPTLMTQVSQPTEMSMVSKYHAKFLEFDVRLEPEGYYWEALYKNTGNEGLPNWGYFIRVFQISRDGSEQKAGYDCVMTYVAPGDTKRVIDTMAWQKKDDTISLRIEMWRTVHTGNHRFITNKTIPFPLKMFPSSVKMQAAAKPLSKALVNTKIIKHSAVTPESVATRILKNGELVLPEDVIRGVRIKSSEYSGMGNWNIEIENTGNYDINPNELTITAKYHIGGSPPLPVSQPFQNNTVISPGQTEIIRGYGLSNEVGCQRFWCIDLPVYYTAKDKTYTHVIDTPDVLSATIDEVKLERSVLSYRLVNMTPYPIKVTVELEDIEIWDGPKPQDDDSAWYEDAWDIFTGGMEFDTSGLQPEEMKCRAQNIVLNSYTLNAGPTTMWADINLATINSRLRAQCPGVTFSSYAYLFKNMSIKLYITAAGESSGNVIGFDNCPNGRTLDQKTISEGGSQADPAFSW